MSEEKLTDWQRDVVRYFASERVWFTRAERDELFAAVNVNSDMTDVRAKIDEIVARRAGGK